MVANSLASGPISKMKKRSTEEAEHGRSKKKDLEMLWMTFFQKALCDNRKIYSALFFIACLTEIIQSSENMLLSIGLHRNHVILQKIRPYKLMLTYKMYRLIYYKWILLRSKK